MRAVDGSKRKNRRAKILKLAKGFKGDRKSNFKPAKDAVLRLLTMHIQDASSRSVITVHSGLLVSTQQFALKVCLTAASSTVFQRLALHSIERH